MVKPMPLRTQRQANGFEASSDYGSSHRSSGLASGSIEAILPLGGRRDAGRRLKISTGSIKPPFLGNDVEK